VTADGFEEGFGVNFLAHFLLTNRLLPSLHAAPAARILHVTSNTHSLARGFDFTDYNWERRRFVGIPAYAHSKLAILLFNRSLARRLAGTTVTSNALHPGVIATGMGTQTLGKTVNDLAGAFFLTPEEGAMTSIYLATSPSVAASQGAYFADSRLARPSRWARDDVAAERLFHLAEALLAERGFAGRRAA
jgi:NAD(P)-dependent dehydrogenase (short-subunit alcohol dehydrogenase family)